MPIGLDGNPAPIQSAARDELLDDLVEQISSLKAHPTVLVGVDGESGTGKSTWADELGRRLRDVAGSVVRSTTDSFHNPRAIRYKRGRTSPAGYYLDSHNLGAMRALLLDPISRGEPFKTACFDEPADGPIDAPIERTPVGGILVFDGLFLHRPELRPYWNYSIFLVATTRLERQRAERAASMPPETVAAFKGRYIDGWQLYVKECDPGALANRLVDNDDFSAPFYVERS
jgi:uridine kinase